MIAKDILFRSKLLNRLLLRGLLNSTDSIALQVLSPLLGQYVPWTSSSMRPSGIVAILNDIALNRRSSIVECGAGVSTLYIARLLREIGRGHLYSLEHDPRWCDLIEHHLRAEHLTDFASLVLAPLTSTRLSWDGSAWYSERDAGSVSARAQIDLLIVDGPPAASGRSRYARYPALPFFWPSLASDYAVVIDDIDRSGEQKIVDRWEKEFSIRFHRRFISGTIAIAHSPSAFLP